MWMATDQDADLYERLCALVATVEGRHAYEEARRDFENREPKWLGQTDLLRRLLQDCQTTTTSNVSSSSADGYDFEPNLIRRLAAEGAWACLAEVVWAESLIFRNADHLINASTTYPNVVTHLESVQAGLIRENDDIRPTPEEEKETNRLIQRMKLMANALEAEHLNARELQILSLYVRRLAARGKSPSSIGPINCKIRRQGNAWNSAWQSVSDQRDGKRNCLWQRVRFAA